MVASDPTPKRNRGVLTPPPERTRSRHAATLGSVEESTHNPDAHQDTSRHAGIGTVRLGMHFSNSQFSTHAVHPRIIEKFTFFPRTQVAGCGTLSVGISGQDWSEERV